MNALTAVKIVNRTLFGLVTLGAIAWLAVIILTPLPMEEEMKIYRATTGIVEGKLKAPATAKFSEWNHGSVRKLEDQKYEVGGHVDSQNGFGAMIRSEWEAVVRQEGRNIRLLALQIGDTKIETAEERRQEEASEIARRRDVARVTEEIDLRTPRAGK